jgi:cellulose synthase/poly-beta-1,6-N-acetylglucosamine synthase-like glycosyltransferase
MNVADILLWWSIALLAWVYVLYPALAWAYGRLRPIRLTPDHELPALVTVGIAVYEGADEIGERVADVLAQATSFELEVIIASDGSDDATSRLVTSAAQSDPRIRLVKLPRVGQSAAQAAIFQAARSGIVVLTDLETRFEPGCLEALVAPLRDPNVGCVTGVIRWRYDEATPIARHEGLYWRYEQAVRRWESRAGWLSAGTGALLAVRRSLHRPVPAHASLDQMLPLIARENAQLVVVTPDAVGTDRGTATLREQLDSRMRIATQGIEANLRMALKVAPWRRPGTALAIWSHKIFRWATPLFAAVAALTGLYLAIMRNDPLFLVPLILSVVVIVLALVEIAASRAGKSIPVASLALTAAAVNWSFASAWGNVLFRREMPTWEPAPAHQPVAEGVTRSPDD